MRHIGILQYSVEGAVLCYATAAREAMQRLGEHRHPLITMAGLSMAETVPLWDNGELDELRAGTAQVVERLAAAGADFFAMPDNTAHIALEQDGPPLALPGLHIADVVMGEAARRGFKSIAVLGTRWTMEGPVYARAAERHGLAIKVPGKAVRAKLHRIILDELCMARFVPSSIDTFRDAVADLADQGCDAAALVCTEIPLILNDSNSALPVLDSTRLLARRAVDVALGEAPLPTWRGGPVQG